MYRHQVFISYRRGGACARWVRQVLKPCLEERLADHVPPPPEMTQPVFLDEEGLADGPWAAPLREAHHRSIALLSVVTHPYFESEWCASEWENMLTREQRLTEAGDSRVLVYGLYYNDGNLDDLADLPEELRLKISGRTLRKCQAYSRLESHRSDNERGEAFRSEIESLCNALRPLLRDPPTWDPDWPTVPSEAIHRRRWTSKVRQ